MARENNSPFLKFKTPDGKLWAMSCKTPIGIFAEAGVVAMIAATGSVIANLAINGTQKVLDHFWPKKDS